MPNINLIQEQRIAIKQEERKARIAFFAFAGVATLSLISVGFLLFQTEQAHSEESALQAKAQRIQPLVEELDSVQADLMKFSPRVTTLDGARKVTEKWSHVLDHLTGNMPPETWLTQVRAQRIDPKSNILVTLSGMTTRQELIGELMLNMQRLEDLTSVNLKYSQEKPVQMGSQLEFQVEAGLVGTEEEKDAPTSEEATPGKEAKK